MPTVPWGATQEHILISEAKTLQATNPGDGLAIAIRSALAYIRQQDESHSALLERVDQMQALLNLPPSAPVNDRQQRM